MRGTSPILVTAALSVAALIAAVGMHAGTLFEQESGTVVQADQKPAEFPQYLPIADADGNGTPDWQDELAHAGISLASPTTSTATSSDPLISIAANVAEVLYGGYLSLKQYGEFTPGRGEQLASTVAANMRAPRVSTLHTVDELLLDNDTSEKRVLAYRAEMRSATAPMVTSDEPEFEMFGQYVSTKDPAWLSKLQDAAARYRTVEKNTLALRIPKDAAAEHLRTVNALAGYADTLERLSLFADDALASAALLRSLNDAEQEMLTAFNALAQYYVRKVTN